MPVWNPCPELEKPIIPLSLSVLKIRPMWRDLLKSIEFVTGSKVDKEFNMEQQ